MSAIVHFSNDTHFEKKIFFYVVLYLQKTALLPLVNPV